MKMPTATNKSPVNTALARPRMGNPINLPIGKTASKSIHQKKYPGWGFYSAISAQEMSNPSNSTSATKASPISVMV